MNFFKYYMWLILSETLNILGFIINREFYWVFYFFIVLFIGIFYYFADYKNNKISKIKKAYIAGPYSASTAEETRQNCVKAVKIAKFIYDKYCYNVFVPHLNFSYMISYEDTEFGREKIMQLCFDEIDRCDIVFFSPDWKKSPGSVREEEYARKKKKKIIYLTHNYEYAIFN